MASNTYLYTRRVDLDSPELLLYIRSRLVALQTGGDCQTIILLCMYTINMIAFLNVALKLTGTVSVRETSSPIMPISRGAGWPQQRPYPPQQVHELLLLRLLLW